MLHPRVIPACSIVIGCLVTTARAAPEIGTKAPAVKIAEWINHKPPVLPGAAGADKHVFVVEFWATWCGPCWKSIPHLAKLHEKHGKDGLIIIGVSNEETDVVKAFVDKKMKMPYYVGLDDAMATNEAWMEGVPGIPHAYLVDRSNTIVWAGNPLDEASMDSAIEQVLAGRFDVEAAKNAAAAAKKYDALMGELQAAYTARDKDKVFKLLDEMIAVKPRELHAYLIKRQLLGEFERADEIPQLDALIDKHFADSAMGMAQLAAMELEKELADRDAGRLLRYAKRASELSDHRDPDALAMLARVQCELGMIDAAIATQKQAVALASDDQTEAFKKVLAYYTAAKNLATSK